MGLGCQLDGVVGLSFIWKSSKHPLPQEADRVLDSEPSYYLSLVKFIFALLRLPALFPTLDIKIKVSRGDTGNTPASLWTNAKER